MPETEQSLILSILICSLEARKELLQGLLASLYAQIKYLPNPESVEIIYLVDNKEITVGAKRNKLLEMARGKYVVFVDDDDRVAGDYVARILDAVKTSPDAVGITGIITWDLRNPKMFRHSMDYGKESPTIEGVYNKPPYHVCPILAAHAKAHKFPEISYGEDSAWAMEVFQHIRTCTTIPVPIYLYDFRFKGTETHAKNPITAPATKPILPRRQVIRKPTPTPKNIVPTSHGSRHFENGVLKRT
jgi:glycosyltransferase involved in cell wall biosynthesis